MKLLNLLKQLYRSMTDRHPVLCAFVLIILSMTLIPLLLCLPPIRNFVRYLLSFTDNPDYKIAYLGLWGTMLGSFIAIYGALWTQRKIDQRHEESIQRKHALVLYYDLSLAIRDLREAITVTKINHNLDRISGSDAVSKFALTAVGRKLYLNENWISDVAELSKHFTPMEINEIYRWYCKLTDVDRAFQSGNPTQIYRLFSRDILYFFSEDESTLRPEIQALMDKIQKLALL